MYNNRLENFIADNHVWQMNFRIFTMAAFTVYGELPEADTWVDYCYNLWLARFPGLNKDGGWHNGDSYFIVNVRTLIEVPYFYSRITGYNYFNDPWYQGNALYVIYHQPPFSKSAGNGSAHLNVTRPRGSRVGYADALARMTRNTYAADYVRIIQAGRANILEEDNVGKEAGLGWFRLQCNKPLPTGAGLKDLPLDMYSPKPDLLHSPPILNVWAAVPCSVSAAVLTAAPPMRWQTRMRSIHSGRDNRYFTVADTTSASSTSTACIVIAPPAPIIPFL